jgi:hypothetical protein
LHYDYRHLLRIRIFVIIFLLGGGHSVVYCQSHELFETSHRSPRPRDCRGRRYSRRGWRRVVGSLRGVSVNSRSAILTALAVSLSALAIASVPCPDPYQYHITNGYCGVHACGGYYGVPYTLTQGGCAYPGHSSVKCGIELLAINAQSGVVSGGAFANICGEISWLNCTVTTYSLLGVHSGKSTTYPCTYNCGLPE